jgi:soluble lytic murein transglycosylase-like protein
VKKITLYKLTNHTVLSRSFASFTINRQNHSQSYNNADIEGDENSESGRYKIDKEKGFSSLIPKSMSRGWEIHYQKVTDTLRSKGDLALDDSRLIPAETIKEAIKNSNSPNYQYPPIALAISKTLGGKVSPWEVLNRQAQAQKLGSLQPPPAFAEAQKSMRPEFLRLLTYNPSSNTVRRAYASMANFNPALIPNGYGSLIQSAAKSTGVDAALLAGLIETESNFTPNRTSKSGAQGVAQFMPATAAEWGVNVNDPASSIQGAAKYLTYLKEYFGGDLNKAITAYNGGMVNVKKYNGPIPGDAENQAYLGKVLRNAAKYGYGAPGGQPWANPALINPKLAYITGNIGPTNKGSGHLDVKEVGGQEFSPMALDNFVEVDYGGKRVPLSKVPVTDTFAAHVARGSTGIDYGTPSGSKVYLKGGVRVLGSTRDQYGDRLLLQLPNGKKYTFLHGKSV